MRIGAHTLKRRAHAKNVRRSLEKIYKSKYSIRFVKSFLEMCAKFEVFVRITSLVRRAYLFIKNIKTDAKHCKPTASNWIAILISALIK